MQLPFRGDVPDYAQMMSLLQQAGTVIPFRKRGDEVAGPEMGGRPAYRGGGEVTQFNTPNAGLANRYGVPQSKMDQVFRMLQDRGVPPSHAGYYMQLLQQRGEL